jgi:putative membrane protein
VTTDSELANDRTFLAWLRTGIALVGLGFVVSKVALIVKQGTGGVSDQALYSGVGVLLVLCGGALVLFGYVQHANLAKVLRGDEALPPARWPRTIAVGAAAGSLLLSALIVITT